MQIIYLLNDGKKFPHEKRKSIFLHLRNVNISLILKKLILKYFKLVSDNILIEFTNVY